MVDRVQVLKQESTALGGQDADSEPWPSPINPLEDIIEARGLYVQDTATRDENVLISRDGSDMNFKDLNNPTALTLTQLLGGLGARSEEQTVGATTADLFTRTMTAGTARTFICIVSGVDTGDTVRCSFIKAVRVHRTAAGAAVLGTIEDIYFDRSDIALEFTFVASTNDVIARVTGKTGLTIDWEGLLIDTETTPGTPTGPRYTMTAVQTSSPVAASIDQFVRIDTDTIGADSVVDLPVTSGLAGGSSLIVKMSFGTAGTTATYKATLTPNGSDTIDGAASLDMTGERELFTLWWDGSSNWEVS